MRLHRAHLAICFFALLGACGSVPPYAALPNEARDRIASSEVVIPIRQAEIYVYVPPTTAGAGFGLVGALIDVTVDSVRSSKAEAAIKPLRNALVDYDFDASLKADIAASLTPVSWLGAGKFRVMKEVTQDSLDGALTGSQAGAVLLTTVDYNLSNDGDVLTISLHAGLYPINDALTRLLKKPSKTHRTDAANSLYRNVLTFQTKIPDDPAGRDAYIAHWSAGNGAIIRAALNQGAVRLAHMLAEDLQRSQAEGEAAAKAGNTVKLPGMFSGKAIASDADGTLVRMDDGSLIFATHSVLPI